MKELKPVRDNPRDWDDIEKAIKDLFLKEVYRPLMAMLGPNREIIKNSRDDLIEAIRTGRLTFNKGKFSGKLNSSITKQLKDLGAKWDKTLKVFSIKRADLPMDIQALVMSSQSKFADVLSTIDQKLRSITPEVLADKLQISKMFDRSLWKFERSFKQSVKNITVAPNLTPQNRQKIADEWQNNMQLWVKDFTEKEITSLRGKVRETYFKGNRYESLIKTIKDSYNVTENKAKFLARQETNLLMTKYTYGRYQEAGVNEYKWKAVIGTPNHPTRPMHKELSDRSARGEIFRFDNPPIDDPNGSRHNPKENYNCRCVAIPLLR